MIPASRKKMNEVIRYMYPMTLWSVEESQPARIDPLVGVRGESGAPPAPAACGSFSVVTGPSPPADVTVRVLFPGLGS
jgi:hypothetical protein